jgi:hypothetical protein
MIYKYDLLIKFFLLGVVLFCVLAALLALSTNRWTYDPDEDRKANK